MSELSISATHKGLSVDKNVAQQEFDDSPFVSDQNSNAKTAEEDASITVI